MDNWFRLPFTYCSIWLLFNFVSMYVYVACVFSKSLMFVVVFDVYLLVSLYVLCQC